MSSIRNLKKNIDYLVFEVISDCFGYSELHPYDKAAEISAIINDAVILRNELVQRINNPDGKDNPKIVKAYYKSVENDLFTGVDALFERLSALSSTKE
jgi:tRNA splicing ligase